MARAFPSRQARRAYLESLIKGKPISRGNLQLAHLLGSRKLASIVITPNFDDQLPRALSLFQTAHVVSDHPATSGRIETDREDVVQVVYVHGSYWFYDCKNLVAEVEEDRALGQVSALLDRVFASRPPLVLGYSGGENDVIMQSLRSRLADGEPLPYPLYWFVHSRRAESCLPSWLTAHADVRLVVPDLSAEVFPPITFSVPEQVETLPEEGDEPVIRVTGSHAMGISVFGPLDASRALQELIRRLSLPSPAIFEDPLAEVSDRLRAELGKASVVSGETDPYGLEALATTLADARAAVAEAEKRGAAGFVGAWRALRSMDYEKALEVVSRLPAGSLTESQVDHLANEFMGAVPSAVRGSDVVALSRILQFTQMWSPRYPRSHAALLARIAGLWMAEVLGRAAGGHERAAEILAGLIAQVRPKESGAWRLATGSLHFHLARHLEALGRTEEALASYRDAAGTLDMTRSSQDAGLFVVSTLSAVKLLAATGRGDEGARAARTLSRELDAMADPPIEWIALARMEEVTSLQRAALWRESARSAEDIILRFRTVPLPSVRRQVAMAFVARSTAMARLPRSPSPRPVVDQLRDFLGDSREPGARLQLMVAESNCCQWALRSSNPEKVIEELSRFIEQFGEDDDPLTRENVAHFLLRKAAALEGLGRVEEAVELYEAVSARLEGRKGVPVQRLVASALLSKGIALQSKGDSAGAREAYGRVIATFRDQPDALVRGSVGQAMTNLGSLEDTFGNREVAQRLFEGAEALLASSERPGDRETVGLALTNQSASAGMRGLHSEALEMAQRALQTIPKGSSFRCLALANLAGARMGLGEPREAERVLKQLIGEFGSSKDPQVVETVAQARRALARDQ